MICFAAPLSTTMLAATRLTDRELRDLARRHIAGEAPLDVLVNTALFGTGHNPSKTQWQDWPKHAKDAWDKAVWYYRLMTTYGVDPTRPRQRAGPTLRQTWAAIDSMAQTTPGPWWQMPNLTWPRLAPILGIGEASVSYYLVHVQGWRFAGRASSRSVVLAPCESCGAPNPPQQLSGHLCRRCVDEKRSRDRR